MVFSQLCGRIKILFIGIIGIFRRALCCFSRRRKPSTSECETLECVNVVIEYSPSKTNERERDWNSWDDSPRTVEEHIEQYRQTLVRPPTPEPTEPEPDFFKLQNMTPEIKPQTKLYIKPRVEQKTDYSRLEAKSDIPIAIAPDLEDWEDEDAGGWEELDSEKTKQLIREKRKELRHQRQMKSKQKTNSHSQNFAERIGHKNS